MEAIKVENLCKNYKTIKALKNVNLEVKENELYGLLGVNGAGKTTLIKILTGLIKKTSGKAFILGYDIDAEMEKIKQIVDVSPQEVSIAGNLTVSENLKFFSEIYGTVDENEINNIVEMFQLEEVLNQKAKTLSGGWQRRLSIAVGMVSKPKVLFLDEPTLGLDVLARRELWRVILKLKTKITIVLTSHYLEEIEELCDRVAILSKGTLITTGTIEEIKKLANTTSFEDAFVKIVEGAK